MSEEHFDIDEFIDRLLEDQEYEENTRGCMTYKNSYEEMCDGN